MSRVKAELTPEEIQEKIQKSKDQKERRINEWVPKKVKLAHDYIENEETQKKRGIVRGAVHLCQFGENIGSEQNEERPVIVISNDTINANSGNVLVIPLTKTLKKKIGRNGKPIYTKDGMPIPRYDSHYFLFKKKYDFLTYDSAVKAEETTSVSKVRLTQHLGTVDDPNDLQRLEVRVKWVFSL
ncbi:type II toxin-antitoxin system PemK/MazF family toxin [Brevibacillus agri]|uniref:type II toxin-antitoxin system PemK/MazF family toxin n=1 Tax=Brevibacillus agri TaxID=51101 RepID=UPI002867E1DD|nr:type II toxin-antitoxin system PemK/MazF family toxin [Brevibacillus agri]